MPKQSTSLADVDGRPVVCVNRDGRERARFPCELLSLAALQEPGRRSDLSANFCNAGWRGGTDLHAPALRRPSCPPTSDVLPSAPVPAATKARAGRPGGHPSLELPEPSAWTSYATHFSRHSLKAGITQASRTAFVAPRT